MDSRKIISMQCGDNESYALLFQEKGGKVVLDIYDAGTHSLVQSLDTPFPLGGIGGIRHVQSFDVMFFAQGETRPCKLVRKKEDGAYTFSFEDNEFLPEPILDWNVNSEHTINVFALPDSELIKTKEDGTQYYPKGVVRETVQVEEVSISYAYRNQRIIGDYTWESRCYCFAPTENASKYKIGKAFKLSTPIQIYCYTNGSPGYTVTAEHTDGEPTEVLDGVASFDFARVDRIGENGVYFYVGRFLVRTAGVIEIDNSGANTVSFDAAYGDTLFYVSLIDAPADASLTNEIYYSPISGGGFEIGVTIDGSNTNENVDVDQILALQYESPISLSEMWDYEAFPVGTEHSPVPPVNVLPPLLGKQDAEGDELRPQTGGGYGNASEWVPVRGEVELKTEGLWSGVIELQEKDSKQTVSKIATITSENGASNTSLTRIIDSFGSSVRVACTRREKAFQVNKSVNGEGSVFSKVLCVDEGLQWTLTSAETQTAFLRIKEKRTLSSGIKCYIAEVIGGVNGSFGTTSYALGAWSKTNGYPKHIAIYQERLVYAGNEVKPTTLWLSKTNGWDDFELGTEASSAISATLATEKYDAIQWILPTKNGITIGTSYNEYSFGASDGGITTADNARATATSSIGSSGVRADMFGTATVMVKTGGEELYRIDYNTLSEESAGNQISLLASHLFQGDPVVDMFAVKAPSNMLFCLHKSGKLSSLTYEPEYSVTGWAQHEVLDGVISGCALRRSGKDVLCLVVKRGDKYVLGEIDLQSKVWTDDGQPYESSVVTTPISFANTPKYGDRKIIAGCDIYVGKESKQFYVKLPGGDWTRIDNGFDSTGSLREFDASRVEIPATSSWEDEAIVEVKSSSPEPLVLYAIGASVMA